MPKASRTFNLELSLEAWLVVHLLIGLFQKLVLSCFFMITTLEHKNIYVHIKLKTVIQACMES